MGDDLVDYPPTELAGAAESNTEASFAWSLDDTPEVVAYRPPWIARAAVAAALVLIAAAGGVALLNVREPGPVAAPPAPVIITTTVAPEPVAIAEPEPTIAPAPKPAPPPVVVETAAMRKPPPPPPAPEPPQFSPELVAMYDRQFMANLRADNWTIWDPQQMAHQGHWVCGRLQMGMTPYAVSTLLYDISPREQQSFVSTAMRTYPDCP